MSAEASKAERWKGTQSPLWKMFQAYAVQTIFASIEQIP